MLKYVQLAESLSIVCLFLFTANCVPLKLLISLPDGLISQYTLKKGNLITFIMNCNAESLFGPCSTAKAIGLAI